MKMNITVLPQAYLPAWPRVSLNRLLLLDSTMTVFHIVCALCTHNVSLIEQLSDRNTCTDMHRKIQDDKSEYSQYSQ